MYANSLVFSRAEGIFYVAQYIVGFYWVSKGSRFLPTFRQRNVVTSICMSIGGAGKPCYRQELSEFKGTQLFWIRDWAFINLPVFLLKVR